MNAPGEKKKERMESMLQFENTGNTVSLQTEVGLTVTPFLHCSFIYSIMFIV